MFKPDINEDQIEQPPSLVSEPYEVPQIPNTPQLSTLSTRNTNPTNFLL